MEIKLNGLNHFALAVSDLSASLIFYRDILGMTIIPRPAFDFSGAWLDCCNDIAIHLITSESSEIKFSGSRSLHFAFTVADIHLTKQALAARGIAIIKDIKARPDGVLQMFIMDPDGYYIELNQF